MGDAMAVANNRIVESVNFMLIVESDVLLEL